MNDLQDRLKLTAFANLEHHRIRDLLAAVHCCGNCPEGDKQHHGTSTRELLASLEALHANLSRQFQEELEGGLVEEAACQCPSLAGEVRELVHDHTHLLASLGGFVQRVKECVGRGCVPPSFSHWFEAFSRKLASHEEKKRRVLATGLGINVED